MPVGDKPCFIQRGYGMLFCHCQQYHLTVPCSRTSTYSCMTGTVITCRKEGGGGGGEAECMGRERDRERERELELENFHTQG